VFTRHDFDMSIVGHAEPMDYDIYARDDYYFGYSNDEFKALIATLDDTIDPAQRRLLLQRIQRKLADDAVNGFLFQYPRQDIWNAHFHDLGFDNVLGVVDLSRARDDRPASAGISRGPGAATHDGARPAAAAASADSAGQPPALRIAGWLVLLAALTLCALVARGFGSAYLAGRLGVLMATLLMATAVVFVVVQIVPGDPVHYMMGLQADPDSWAATRHQLGLDVAPARRYLLWIGGMLHGDFGRSFTYRIPVRLHWVSAGGFPGWDAGLLAGLEALTLPALALAMPQAAILAHVLRGSLIDTLQEDYIRTARAKGAGEWQVLWHHALPNALVPVLTIVGMQFSFLLAGGVIIENVFFLPGLGRLVFQAIVQRDLMVVQSVVIMLVFAVVSVTFLVDLSYVLVNPRLRTRGAA
jgi:peptide/nickel transport system substrate-binding protein